MVEYAAAEFQELAHLALMEMRAAEREAQIVSDVGRMIAAEVRRKQRTAEDEAADSANFLASAMCWTGAAWAGRRKRKKEAQPNEAELEAMKKYAELKRALSDLEKNLNPRTVVISNRSVSSWCLEFISKFFEDIRNIICGSGGGPIAEAAGFSAKGAATALAAWITSAAGMTSPIALGLAVMILLVISTATKGAFCRMSRDAVVTTVTEEI